MAEKLCKKKRANVTSSFDFIFSQRVHAPEKRVWKHATSAV